MMSSISQMRKLTSREVRCFTFCHNEKASIRSPDKEGVSFRDEKEGPDLWLSVPPPPFLLLWNYVVGLNRVFGLDLWSFVLAVSSACTALHSHSSSVKSQLAFKVYLQCFGPDRASSPSSSPTSSPLDKSPAQSWSTR